MKVAVARSALIGGLLLAVAPVDGATAESWSASSAAELSLGTLDGVALDERGQIRLAPDVRTLWGPESGVVWSVAPTADGGAFVAMSGPARVVRVDRSGAAESWYETREEVLITSVAGDGTGGLLLGESPAGRVLRGRRTAGGAIDLEPFVDTDARFIWALARDDDGGVWIGTGVPGLLLRRGAKGEAEIVFDAGDDPVRSIHPVPGGGVVIGTGGRGRVIRVDREGRAFVLHDADEPEIVSVAVDRSGSVFALAARASKQPGPRPPAAAATPTSSNSVTVVAEPRPDPGEQDPAQQQQGQPARPQRPQPPRPSLASQPGGTLYRIDSNGDVRRIWSTSRDMPFAMVLDDEARLVIATGDEGRLYALDREGRATRLLRVASDQASALARTGDGGLLVGGTSDARLELVGPGPRGEGSYLTLPVDAGSAASWGRLRWDGELPSGSRIEVDARSGNTAEPDDTWTPWASLRSRKGESAAATDLPAARWFQARFRLLARTESPLLRSVEVAYQPRNRSPVITGLTIEPTGVVWLRGPVQSAFAQKPLVAEDPVARKVSAGLTKGRVGAGAIRKAYEPGARTCSWSADDPDNDRLRYALEIRRNGSDDWFPLALDLEEQFYSWDARGMPDGSYRVRLRVDDALDNPNGTHRSAEELSTVFVVDNTRPGVDEIDVRESPEQYEVLFVANDQGGSVAAVEVAVDGGEWIPLSPVDGVADSESESYRFVLPRENGASNPALMLRVIDASGNLGGAIRRLRP